jgi:hypothetical protein
MIGRAWFKSAFVAAMVTGATCAHAQTSLDAGSEAIFHKATVALQAGAPNEAVAALELLADRGILHPDVSFNRAVAYIKRARTSRAQPGDLGRAVAALEETITLRPSDTAAAATLERVQSELSRERSRRGAQSLLVRPSIGRALVRLFPENFWAFAAMAASALCTLGLLAAWLAPSARRRFVGRAAASIAGALGIVSASMLYAAVQTRHRITIGVVTVPEARLRDAAGIPLPVSAARDTTAIPEGALVDIARTNDRYVEILWGETSAWVQVSDLQVLPKR